MVTVWYFHLTEAGGEYNVSAGTADEARCVLAAYLSKQALKAKPVAWGPSTGETINPTLRSVAQTARSSSGE